MMAKQTKRMEVMDARLGVAQAAERLAAEKRSQAEEERSKQVRLCVEPIIHDNSLNDLYDLNGAFKLPDMYTRHWLWSDL
jgi:hypothetical protein